MEPGWRREHAANDPKLERSGLTMTLPAFFGLGGTAVWQGQSP